MFSQYQVQKRKPGVFYQNIGTFPEKSKSQDLLFSFNMHSLSRKGDLMEIVYQDNRIVAALKPAGVLSTDEPGGR